MKAVFLDRESFPIDVNFNLPTLLTDYTEFDITQDSNVIERTCNAEIIITNKVQLTAKTLKKATQLKCIIVTATGTNNIDKEYCLTNNIPIYNVEGYATSSVPEHTFSMLLALKKNLLSYQNAMQSGKWAQSNHFCLRDFPITDIAGSNMVIFGSGSLGKKVAHIAKAFDMNVYFSERKNTNQIRSGYLAFNEAVKIADVMTFHCPLTESTQNMIAEDEFNAMKKSCVIINTGRGGLICEQSLADALNQGKIAGAGFDVATIEPMPKSHVLQKLTNLPNFLLTPHIAWASDNAMQTLADMAMDKLNNFLII